VFWLLKTETNCWTILYCSHCAVAVADVVNSFVDVAANIIVFKFDVVYNSCVESTEWSGKSIWEFQ
jgi:hypothetical protein